jgi:chromosome segregation protein
MTDRGAHFVRCDFQVHTPRDQNWSGARAVSDDDRQSWAHTFVGACRAKGLGAVAITDHHDFTLAWYAREAARTELTSEGQPVTDERRLVVFPGLELTLAVPCQALLLLDADFPDDRLDAVLARLAVSITDPTAASLPSVTAINVALLSELYDELDKVDWLRGRYIVFPNVTDGGHQTLLRAHMHAKYRDMPCVGGYLDGSVESIGEGNRRIFAGLNAEYGNKRIALIQTSDSRSDTYQDLGRFSTWIKWSVPTAEALRQACLAQESRIAHTSPELPITWVSRMAVDNSMFLGPIELEFNSQFNAIIGGRGTGKSTLLDYLRWALCDLPAAVTGDEEIADPSDRQRRLISQTLSPTDSTVEVHFTINDIPHVVRRKARTGELSLKVGKGEFMTAREPDVRELLPIQAYSQKQLSSVAVRIDELTRFITSPIRRQLATIDEQITHLAGRVRENYAALQRKRQLAATIQRLELTERSLSDQALNLRGSLEDVSAADRTVLDEKPDFDNAHALAESWHAAAHRALDQADSLHRAVVELIEGLDDVPPSPRSMADPLIRIHSNTNRLLANLDSSVKAAGDSLQVSLEPGAEYDQLYLEIRDQIGQFNVLYDTVKDRSTAHAAKLAELAAIERQHQAATDSLRSQRRELQVLGQPEVHHRSLMHQLFDLMTDRADLMARQCEALSELSGGMLRATLQRGQGMDALADRLRGAVSGSGLRSSRIEEFFGNLALEASPLRTWEVATAEMEALTLVEPDAALTSEQFPILARLGFNVPDLRRVASKLNSDSWLGLALTAVSDIPKFEYQTKENQFIDFAAASAGQQATALLRALLAQPGPPLVVDQPEDDLDSEIVLDVVEQIWSAKRHRQLIFSSHNANLVVNGDAELVVHCDYRVRGEQSRGEIRDLGAIDMPGIRYAITRVMEGGERAFKLRADKYGF